MGVMCCFVCTAISIVVISRIKNPVNQTKTKFPSRRNFTEAETVEEDDSTSNLSDLVFNNQAINLKFSSNNNNGFHHTTDTGDLNEFYTSKF